MLAPLCRAPAAMYVHRNGKFGQAVMKGGRITRKLVAAWNFTLSTRWGAGAMMWLPRKRLCRTLQQGPCGRLSCQRSVVHGRVALTPALEGSEGLRSHACLGLRVMLGLEGEDEWLQPALQECPFPEQPRAVPSPCRKTNLIRRLKVVYEFPAGSTYESY